jgi:alpha-D-xyloside xylohydrolase
MKRLLWRSAVIMGLIVSGTSAPARGATVERQTDGIVVALSGASLKLQVCRDNIIRMAYAPDAAFFQRKTLIAAPYQPAEVKWDLTSDDASATVSTATLRARVDLSSGHVTFSDAGGKSILTERSRALTPAEVQGETTQHVQQTWASHPDESLYGLGQQQLGILDLKGYDIDLWQRNTNVVVPMLVSSRGYGILWDNLSFSKFGDTRPFESIPAECLIDTSGKPGGLTSGSFDPDNPETLQNAVQSAQIVRRGGGRGGRGAANLHQRWVGEIAPPTTGDYQFQTYSNGGIKLWINDQLVIDHWRQAWLTEYDQVKLRLEAGKRYAIRIESGGDQTNTMRLAWKMPPHSDDTSLWSEVADGIDYYFIYGPQIDKVIAGYRTISGQASMMPVWAFGLWQSKQRYETAQQSLDALDGFRKRGIPIDNIVQDWMYWPQSEWGSHTFDPQRFPDPQGWINEIHKRNARLMISVWGKFYPGTANFEAMKSAGYLYEPTLDANLRDWVGRGYNYAFYDAFSPGARKLFWEQVSTALFSKGVDAWWMDATEPDVVQPSPPTLETTKQYIGKTAAGTASRVLNSYALVNSQAVYEGQRSAAPNQRVFILTRSGFAGTQRYGTATWSGDITSTWTALAKQIPAGLGYSISGVPYWTMDIGGYTMQSRFSARNQTPENAEEWRELNVRWFQFGTFTPLLRVHGELKDREMWTLGGEDHPAYKAELKFDRLRYRLLPYIYSLAGQVTQDGGTIMRPLVMDFPTDASALKVVDQYMFGPAFLVAPVTTYKARSRSVYLPQTGGWYDFWTGKSASAGTTIDAPAPYDQMPLFVEAGSIIPFGPDLQYTTEKPADPITLYVYTGADGAFTLYEDQKTTYDYEHGAFTQIPITWHQSTRTLTIGQRRGEFSGMLTQRTFNVVFISPEKPVPYQPDTKPDQAAAYHGSAIELHF